MVSYNMLMYKKLAIIGLVIVFTGINFRHLSQTAQGWNSDFIADDMVTHWDKRMQPLQSNLPINTTMIGYVGDWDVLPENEYHYAGEETEYILTQYALAPIIVQRSDEHEWVIANLTPKAYDIWITTQPKDIEIIEYGLRIFLVHNP